MAIGRTIQALMIVVSWLAVSPTLAQNTAPGQAIAEDRCSRCHAVKTGQKSKHALALPFPVIARRYSVWGLQEALAEGIVVGHADMPKFVFSPAEINDLLTYMDTFTRTKSKAK